MTNDLKRPVIVTGVAHTKGGRCVGFVFKTNKNLLQKLYIYKIYYKKDSKGFFLWKRLCLLTETWLVGKSLSPNYKSYFGPLKCYILMKMRSILQILLVYNILLSICKTEYLGKFCKTFANTEITLFVSGSNAGKNKGELMEQNMDGLEYSSEEEKEDLHDTLRNMSKKTKKVRLFIIFMLIMPIFYKEQLYSIQQNFGRKKGNIQMGWSTPQRRRRRTCTIRSGTCQRRPRR